MPKYALLMGANYYSIPSVQLNGCIDDINNMRTLLINNFGYSPNNIFMLHDDTNDKSLLPTRENMINKLNNIVQLSNNASEIWIHYSGHGSQISKIIGNNVVGVDNVIVPIDYEANGFIIDDELFRIFSKSKCPTIILMDSCHSGTVCDLPYTTEYLYGNVFKQTRTNRVNIDNKNVFMMSGCKDWQTSEDIQDSGQFEGAFTDAFITSMTTNKFNVNIKKLYQDVCLWMTTKQYTQKPLLSSSSPSLAYQFSNNNNTMEGKTSSQAIKTQFATVLPSFQVPTTLNLNTKMSIQSSSTRPATQLLTVLPSSAQVQSNTIKKRFHLW